MLMPAFNNLLADIASEVSPDLTITTLRCFILIGSRGTITQKEIEDELNLTNASASRNVSYWTDRRFDRTPGMDMVIRETDDYDRRQRNIKLNRKGKEFFHKIKAAIEK